MPAPECALSGGGFIGRDSKAYELDSLHRSRQTVEARYLSAGNIDDHEKIAVGLCRVVTEPK
jgi:hypothetical protein|tara:strand:- start:1296 stop:1481 length:186 start_codon:yes stop_codon:yes gene_type:complete